MNDIVQIRHATEQETQDALATLAGLEELRVMGYERDEWRGEIVWLCKVKHEVAVCPGCQSNP